MKWGPSGMTTNSSEPLKLFYCYAHEDKALRDELDAHLSLMKRQKLVTVWYDREILAGTNWEHEIDTHLTSADIILLLVSARFLASDYCYGIEMQKALQRHAEGTARVVPILLRSVDWEDAPFSHLQILPTEAKPVTRWSDSNDAFEDITKSLRKVVKELLSPLKTKEEWLEEGNILDGLKRYEEAVAAFDHAILLNPNYAAAYYNKGNALRNLKRYEEALVTYDYATQLNPNYVSAHINKGATLNDLKRNEEALAALEYAIQLNPKDAVAAYINKGVALNDLKRNEEAIYAYKNAILLDPNDARAYNNKGNALRDLNRDEEAIIAYNHVIRLDPNYSVAYNGKGNALNGLKRNEEAIVAYNHAIRLNPNDARAYYNKGIALQSMNRGHEAQTAFERAKQLDLSNWAYCL